MSSSGLGYSKHQSKSYPSSQMSNRSCLQFGRKQLLGEIGDGNALGKVDPSFSLLCSEHMSLPLTTLSSPFESGLDKIESCGEGTKESACSVRHSHDLNSDFPSSVS